MCISQTKQQTIFVGTLLFNISKIGCVQMFQAPILIFRNSEECEQPLNCFLHSQTNEDFVSKWSKLHKDTHCVQRSGTFYTCCITTSKGTLSTCDAYNTPGTWPE